jgi:hypothetical protein
MPLSESLCSTLFAAVYKRPRKEGLKLLEGGFKAFLFFDFGFCFGGFFGP